MKKCTLPLLIAFLSADFIEATSAQPDSDFQLVVHAENPATELDREEVAAFFHLEGQRWADGTGVEPVAQRADSPVEDAFRLAIHQDSAAAVRHVWESAAVRGRRRPPPVVEGDRAVLDWVRQNRGAIGYVSRAEATIPGVKVLTLTDREEETETTEVPRRVSLVIDASGSMKRSIDHRPKIDIARGTLSDLLAEWDTGVEVGLTAFGHRAAGCDDVETLIPLGPHRPERVEAALKGLDARGSTPLTQAIRQAGTELAELGEWESRMIVVSDGHESCGGDPCGLVDELAVQGVRVTAYVVGFDILRNPQAQSQLRCLAQRSGGTFELAWDARSLEKALGAAVDRATGRVQQEAPAPSEPPEPAETVSDLVSYAYPDAAVDPDLDLRLKYVPAGFWITDTEITQGDWQLLMDGNPSYFGGCEACPVERVSFNDVAVFANRLSEMMGFESCYGATGECEGTTGSGCEAGEKDCAGERKCSLLTFAGPKCRGFRLPSDKEWEYAARAGTKTAFWQGEDLLPADANCALANGEEGRPKAVRSHAANPLGLHEVHGNVWEWVADSSARERSWQQRQIFSGKSTVRPRSIRGGSFAGPPEQCGVAGREKRSQEGRYHDVGFRLVRTDM